MTPNKIFVSKDLFRWSFDKPLEETDIEYVRKDMVVDAIKLAYGTVSMNPFDCSEAFEELLKKVNHEIH